ncbi:hypothetical protein ACFFX0_02565 [Citricoccus parietis]|uniref:Uncharacterized protein n=1 Tax=Citricoccus parietis TaxID=592307 RepID=A0ABV5FTW9_9MICC
MPWMDSWPRSTDPPHQTDHRPIDPPHLPLMHPALPFPARKHPRRTGNAFEEDPAHRRLPPPATHPRRLWWRFSRCRPERRDRITGEFGRNPRARLAEPGAAGGASPGGGSGHRLLLHLPDRPGRRGLRRGLRRGVPRDRLHRP